MVTGWLIPGRSGSRVGLIVYGPSPGILNTIVSDGPPSALACVSAWRKDPGPLSLVLVTVNVLAPGVTVVCSNSVLSEGFGSDVVAVAPAMLGSEMPAIGVTNTWNEATAPLASVPS